MTTNQPKWTLIANLGDVNVSDYGGFLVYADETGVYPPEVELYEANDDETGGTVSRFILEPEFRSEWWFNRLGEVAGSCGQDVANYVADLESDNPIRTALVYRDVVGYFGAFEFDQYPVQLTEAQAQARYASVKMAK